MFEKLFGRVSAVMNHKTAPFAREREQFLLHCSEQGYSRASLRCFAPILLMLAHNLTEYPDLKINADQIKVAADNAVRMRRSFRYRGNRRYRKKLIRVAQEWLDFLGTLERVVEHPMPFADLVNDFATWMEQERGLSLATIENRRWHLKRFLLWFSRKKRPISSLRVNDVDAYLSACHSKGLSRVTVSIHFEAIRAFLRYAGMKNWCSALIADAISPPRIYSQENLPVGPTWDEVKRLISSTETDRPVDIRDRAIILLFAVYGFRAGEVSALQLDDINWEQDRITVRRPKQRRTQVYPLIPAVSQAIVQYLKNARPKCRFRELFIRSMAPITPMSPGALYAVVATRMKHLGIKSLHLGPHALRHACATHLMSEGFSLKAIGDHLGHRSQSVTRNYAKVDLTGLREVAAFDLGELP